MLLLIQNFTYAATKIAPLVPYTPYNPYGLYDDNLRAKENNSLLASHIDKMEQKLFGKKYKKDNLENRMTRLETKIFGASQSGDLEERYETLSSAVKYYDENASQKYMSQIPATPTSTYTYTSVPKKSMPKIIRTLSSFFAPAMMTGFSPNIVYPNNIPYDSFSTFSYPQINTFSPVFSHPFSPSFSPSFPHHHITPPHYGNMAY